MRAALQPATATRKRRTAAPRCGGGFRFQREQLSAFSGSLRLREWGWIYDLYSMYRGRAAVGLIAFGVCVLSLSPRYEFCKGQFGWARQARGA
jgi:hypothetical protein